MQKELKRSGLNLNIFKEEEFNFQLMRALVLQYYNGASIGECLYTASKIENANLQSWSEEWSKTAAIVEKQAESYKNKSQKISAREAFFRASMYYRSAEYYGFFSSPERFKNWEKSRYCFQEGAKLEDINIKILEIPFEDMKLPGYLLTPSGEIKKRPTLLMMSGFDGTAEELYFYSGAATVLRGYNALIFEGPGQAGSIHLYPDKPLRPDYEAPISSVVDYAVNCPEVDPDKLAIMGFSLGGYFVSRAAVYEKRLKACIPVSPIIDMHSYFSGLNKFKMLSELPAEDYPYVTENVPICKWVIETFGRRFGKTYLSEVLEYMKDFNIKNIEHNINCATLSLVGESEGEEALDQAKKFHERVTGEKAIRIFTAEEGADGHCQILNLSLLNAVVFDWLEEVLNN